MAQVNLLKSLPTSKRDVTARLTAKNQEIISKSKQFGELYFDGPRECGYGGYQYDGRWVTVVRDIIEHYSLNSGSRVLDIGCAKGFLVKDFIDCDIDAYGVDISSYALNNCLSDVVGRLHLGSADKLNFPDNSFDMVISINTIHNLPRQRAIAGLKEIERVSKRHRFVQVDSFHTEEQKEIFESWVLTAEFYDYPTGWFRLFEEAGYTGDFDWTIVE